MANSSDLKSKTRLYGYTLSNLITLSDGNNTVAFAKNTTFSKVDVASEDVNDFNISLTSPVTTVMKEGCNGWSDMFHVSYDTVMGKHYSYYRAAQFQQEMTDLKVRFYLYRGGSQGV